MRQQIEKVSYPPYVEIFARTPEKNNNLIFQEEDINKVNWDYIGKEADGTVF